MTISLLQPLTEQPLAAAEPKRRARGRPSVVQAAELREAFLDAATQSFLEKGYAGTSIEAVARWMPAFAKITIYRQFENKEALFHEVIHRAVEKARTDMHTALKCDKTNTEERLLELIEGMYLGATEPRTLGLLRLVIAEATRFPELAKLVYTENSWVLGPVVAYLAEASTAPANCTCPTRNSPRCNCRNSPLVACASSSPGRWPARPSAANGRKACSTWCWAASRRARRCCPRRRTLPPTA